MAVNQTTISENTEDELWRRYSTDRSIELRNELVTRYLYLVKRIVSRLGPGYQAHNEYDDLISCGVLGLMDAVDRFDITRENKFETYASTRIRGEIIDHMRKQDWAPSSLRRKINQISAAFEKLEALHGRSATEDEVASELGISLTEVNKTLEKSHMFNLLHFEDLLGEGNVAVHEQSSEESATKRLENEEIRQTLTTLITTLSENERLVTTLYYFEEMPIKQIAGILKVSESRVSQIHSKVLVKLRAKLKQLYY